ncbi:L-serine ammonia-lyase [Rhodoferax sp.]|uniref:L-serine ammonia-lyase n=1 Tax=Rhodoferax sp. TaxID=50421 RepID=UPI00272FFC8E|nr:L-serine ammonia-lyase [Rhodoferax sp.]MDP1531055.1 L-serine ammonia-lyase [Rhodoferax sp.]MDP1945072.1 L-serine ammonia-lyase [Rhodoferax sp.]MDP2442324.1 L-serine ammonia-lyase [Rhodoferax sp.]MDP3193054.1 L-serine ammonia-lyase [Rhodoferax sp.]MDP3336610.1 L-serine ammonia-lyase [Rhodoferax sp.]
MAISVFDLFKVGIGPSSSHTVGPMRAAAMFALSLEKEGLLEQTASVKAELYGSLGATGKGHGSDIGIMLGLMGQTPDTVDVDAIPGLIKAARAQQALVLLARQPIAFCEKEHLLMYRREALAGHPNGMQFSAFDAAGGLLRQSRYLSVGGGFVVTVGARNEQVLTAYQQVPHPFTSGDELLAVCQRQGLTISEVMWANERTWRSDAEIRGQLLSLWRTMRECVQRGLTHEGTLPGPFRVQRRAPVLAAQLRARAERVLSDPLSVLDWVNVYAFAVNEENAAGGRVVTAPTNGAAGVIPAVLHYYDKFIANASDEGVMEFLMTAAAIGILYKLNASISGAEVGCQGEVGVACSMAAAGLAAVMGGSPGQIENAAEIGMEHNLGLTCDPVGGLVQVPCIERNAMGAVKALNAARMALQGDGQHVVSLDKVIKTMRETGADMKTKYKETARGGLAVNIVEC